MAQKADPHVFKPEDLANESLFDDEEPLTRPGVASRVPPPRTGPKAPPPAAKAPAQRSTARVRVAKDPDAEALEIVSKVVEKAAVARSLARIGSALLRSYADQKMAEIVETDAGNAVAHATSAMAHVERARRVAMAAKEAAVHAASLAAARAAARTQEFVTEASTLIDSLDPEEAHDDAC
jgi:hypothetical protein